MTSFSQEISKLTPTYTFDLKQLPIFLITTKIRVCAYTTNLKIENHFKNELLEKLQRGEGTTKPPYKLIL